MERKYRFYSKCNRIFKLQACYYKKPIKKSYSHLILPGVGSFGKLSINLEKLSLKQYIYESLKKGVTYLEYALECNYYLKESEESPDHKGLSLIEGNLKKISPQNRFDMPLPHIGFSKVSNKSSKLFHNLEKTLFYFILLLSKVSTKQSKLL